MSFPLGVIQGALRLVSNVRPVVNDSVAALGALDKSIKQNQYGVVAMSRAYTAMGAAVAAGFAMAIKSAVEWEDALAGVQRTAKASDAELAGLEAGLRRIAATKPIKPIELAGIAEEAGALGVAQRDIIEFTGTVADLVATTELTADEASSGLARLTGIMGNTVSEFGAVGSAILELGRSTKATDAEILNMSRRIAGAGKVVGLSTDQVLAYAAAMASVGIREEQGGSGISRTFIDIQNAVHKGGEELATFAKLAGEVDTDAFRELFNNNAAEATLRIIEGLGKAGEAAIPILNSLGITEIRQRDVLLRLAAGTQNFADENVRLRNVLKIGAEAMDENTVLSQLAAQRYETAASQLQILSNMVFEASTRMGQALLPTLKSVVEAAQDFTEKFNAMSPSAQRVIFILGGLIALSAGLVLAISSVSVALLHMHRVMSTASVGAVNLGGAMKFLSKTIALSMAGLVAYLGYVAIFGKKAEEAAEGPKQIARASDELVSSLEAGGERAGKAVQGLADRLRNVEGSADIFQQLGIDAQGGAESLVNSAGMGIAASEKIRDALVTMYQNGQIGAKEFIETLSQVRQEFQDGAVRAQINTANTRENTEVVEENTEARKKWIQAAQDAWDAQDRINQAIIDSIQAGFDARGAVLDLANAQDDYARAVEDAGNFQRDLARATEDLADAQRDLNRAQEDAIDAERNLARARARAADALADAEDDLADAQDARADSIDKIYDAQQRLNKLRSEETVRNLIKATNDLIRAQLGLIDSNRDVADAQFYLNYLRERGASARDIADAEFALAVSQLGVADAQDTLADAEQGVIDAREEQLRLPREIAAAERDLESARRDAQGALRDLAEAEADLAEERQDYASDRAYRDALRDQEDAQNAIRDAVRGVEDATENLHDVQRRDPARELAEAQLALEQSYYNVAQSNVEVQKQAALMRGEYWDAGREAQALAGELGNLAAAAEDSNSRIADSLKGIAGTLGGAKPQSPRPENNTDSAGVDIPSLGDEGFIDPTGEGLANALDDIKTLMDGVSAGFDTSWKDFVVPTLVAMGPNLAWHLGSALFKQDGVLRKAGGKVAEMVMNGLNGATVRAMLLRDKVVTAVSGALSAAGGALKGAATKVGTFISEGLAKAAIKSQLFKDKVVNAASAGMSAASGALKGLGTKAATLIGSALQAAGTALGAAMTVMWTTAQSILAAAIPILTAILPYLIVAALVAGIIYVLIETGIGEKIINALVDGIKAAADFLVNLGEWVWENILTKFDDAVKWLFEIGKKIFQGLKDGLVWLWEHSIYKWLWDRKDAILGFFANAGTWLLEIGKKIITGLWNGLKAIWEGAGGVASWVGGLGGKIIGFFGKAGEWLLEGGKNVIRGLWNGLKAIWEGAGSVFEWLGGLPWKIMGIFGKAKDWLWDAGKNIMEGLKNGIVGAARSVANAVLTPINWVIKNVINSFMNGIGQLASKIGVEIQMPVIPELALPQFHEGGTVGKGGKRRNLRRSPLRSNEELAVLLQGERVLSPEETKYYEKKNPNAIRHIGGINWPDLDIPNPLDDLQDLAGDALDRVVAGARKVAAEVVKPMINAALSLLDRTVGEWGPLGEFLGGFGHNIGDMVLRWIEGAENPGEALGPITAMMGSIIDVGRRIQQMGYRVSEHPAFGGVDPVHSPRSYHYRGRAIDVNSYPAGFMEMQRLDDLYAWIRKNVAGVKELLWRVPGHFNHLHLAMATGGVVTGPTRALVGEAGPEAVIPLDRLFRELERMLQNAMLPLLQNSDGITAAQLAKYASLSTEAANLSRLAYANSTVTHGGDDIDINVHTDADPEQIASAVMWRKRTRLN